MLNFLEWINSNIVSAFLPAVLFVSGVYFIIRIGRFVFRPVFVFRCIFNKENKKDKPTNKKTLSDKSINTRTLSDKSINSKTASNKKRQSPFSSLCLALAGTLGVGNISGVTAAIIVGGAGCVFWIWVCAFVSSVLKFAETVLAVHYRQRRSDGSLHGGAHLYIKNGLKAPRLASFFCILCIITSFTMGNITQTKAAADGVFTATGFSPYVSGIIFFLIVLYLSFGGARVISSFTLKLIPPLCLVYILLSVSVIFIFRDNIPYVTSLIFSEAFTPRAGLSGFLGFLSCPALKLGITRGIMSNEAGCGTAPMAHASADTDSAVRQGFYGIVEVMCDTLLLCTLTAYTVLLSEVSLIGSSTEVAINAFSVSLGEPVKILLGISIFLFALGSVASWSFYGQESIRALGLGKKSIKIYGAFFAFSAFLGCVIPEGIVWQLADLSISAMALINIAAVLLLSETVIKLTKSFCKKDTSSKTI